MFLTLWLLCIVELLDRFSRATGDCFTTGRQSRGCES
jgi:hypothetical protein